MRNIFIVMLSYLGALIFLIGYLSAISSYFQTDLWSLAFLLTLGAGLVSYWLGVFFYFKFQKLEGPLFLISGVLFFLGLQIIFSYFGFYAPSFTVQWIVSFVLVGACLVQFYFLRKSIFIAMALIFLTYFIVKISNHWSETYFSLANQEIFPIYLILGLGIIFNFLGVILNKTSARYLNKVLYFLGTPLFLGAVLILNLSFHRAGLIWIFMLLGSVFLAFIFSLSPGVKSKIILTWASIFLIINLLWITELFFPHVSWAVFLILLGVFLMLSSGLSWMLIKKLKI